MKKSIFPVLSVFVLFCGAAVAQNTGSSTATTTDTQATTTDNRQSSDLDRDKDKDAKKHERVDAQGRPVSDDRANVDKRLREASRNLTEITNAPDKGIPENVLSKAKCVAIVPDLVKGGFVFGAQHGRGVATCRTSAGWSSPAFFTVTGGSWGAQIGVESVDLVMLFMDQQGANKLLDANFKIGGDVSAAAGPVGRDASANTDWKLNSQVLTYSRAKGAFVGITLNGASVRQDDDSTKAFYGRNYDFRTLLSGQVKPPAQATPFLASVRKDFREAVAEH